MQRAPSSESSSLLQRSPTSLMAATAALPLLTAAERHALFTPAERSVYESFLTSSPTTSSSSSSAMSSSSITTIRDPGHRHNGSNIHDPDWQLYNQLGYPSSGGGGPVNHALAKATKDLIALQPPPPSSDYGSHSHSHVNVNSGPLSMSISSTGGQSNRARALSVRSNSSSSSTTLAGTNSTGNHHPHHRPIAPAPAGGAKSTRTLTNPSSPPIKRLRHSHSPPLPPPHSSVGTSTSVPYGSHSTSPNTTGTSSLYIVSGTLSSSASSSSPTPQGSSSSSKPTLLSPQQKKANHIQSEQKRRANIRKGYEALCETIPALREAIRAEEEMSQSLPNHGIGIGGIPKKRRSREDNGEKTDGRAGPRSESVVLQKTIEHIQGLLYEKDTLTSRLERARAILSPSHPALNYTGLTPPLWEREWDGGKGLMVVNGEVLEGSDEE
ncbi:hypothetical protein Clacol_002443 [Clathrus columnatus]|uniref:BHLH domain-containing protein n=1 Tax=Clathrus columnatus TaxID=1419009 RepID=A0AAV5A0V8_9AGAM|nr:hypothetical protein Clacol_002443 [Clathrus columnatus]